MGALDSNVQTAAALSGLLNNLFGTTATKSSSGGTTTSTKQTQYSDAAVQALIKGLMEDPRTGLAKVASSSKAPGMYNTTSQQMLVNDLITRAAGQAEIARAPTVTTETKPGITEVTKTAGQANSILPLLGATMLFSKGKDGNSGWDAISSAMGGAFGGSGTDSSFGSTLLEQADSELTAMMPTWYGEPAAEIGGDAIGQLISSLSTDGSSGIDIGIDIAGGVSDIVSSAGDFVSGAIDYGKDLWNDATEWISSWF